MRRFLTRGLCGLAVVAALAVFATAIMADDEGPGDRPEKPRLRRPGPARRGPGDAPSWMDRDRDDQRPRGGPLAARRPEGRTPEPGPAMRGGGAPWMRGRGERRPGPMMSPRGRGGPPWMQQRQGRPGGRGSGPMMGPRGRGPAMQRGGRGPGPMMAPRGPGDRGARQPSPMMSPRGRGERGGRGPGPMMAPRDGGGGERPGRGPDRQPPWRQWM